MRAQHFGHCYVCGGPYSTGAHIEQDGMADVGTPFQRWLVRHIGSKPKDGT